MGAAWELVEHRATLSYMCELFLQQQSIKRSMKIRIQEFSLHRQGMKALHSQGRGRKHAIALNYFYNWSAIVPGLSFSPMGGKVFNNSSHFWNHLRLVYVLFMCPHLCGDLPTVDGTRLRLGSLGSGRHNQDGDVSRELWR